MPIRFPTEAANDPGMGPEGMPSDSGAECSSRGRADGSRETREPAGKPGKDINQAGFVRERDSSEPDR
jgi:hypothetical protein